MEIFTTTTLDQILESLADQCTHEELLQFIADLDMAVADWDFTEALYAWAKEQHRMFEAANVGFDY